MCMYDLFLGTCQAPSGVNGVVSRFLGTEFSPNGTYPVGSRLSYRCNTGYRRYGWYFYSDCIEPGIWAQPFTDCLSSPDESENNW